MEIEPQMFKQVRHQKGYFVIAIKIETLSHTHTHIYIEMNSSDSVRLLNLKNDTVSVGVLWHISSTTKELCLSWS
jgi:hypothetical protein